MFRAILGADLHGSDRTEEELRYSTQLFHDAYVLAQDHDASFVAWLGDLLHFKYGLSVSVLTSWSRLACAHKIPTYLIRGNHDTPWPDQPDVCPLALVPGATAVLHPHSFVIEGTLISMLPWFPEREFIKKATEMSSVAMLHHSGPRFLLSHTSLQEGHVSVSNTRLETPVRAHHLHPQVWDHVILGDYHASQEIGDSITYLGTPRYRTFGDYGVVGLWLLEVDGDDWSLEPVGTPTQYPEYKQVQLGPGQFKIPFYRDYDRYLVTCPAESREELKRRYPRIKIQTLVGEGVPAVETRTADLDLNDRWAVYCRWRDTKGLNPQTYDAVARKMIGC